MDHKINLSEEIKVSESISISTESVYLLVSNREKITDLLCNSELNRENIIDIFISLHIVLEVGVNTLFRQIVGPVLKKQIDFNKMIDNLDNVNFVDKTVMFVYYSKFNFDDLEKASDYHSIIGKMKSFSEMRNRLLHGHSISTRNEDGRSMQSETMKKLNLEKLQTQLNDFKFILEGLAYYLKCLEGPITLHGKEAYISSYLDYSFLPE